MFLFGWLKNVRRRTRWAVLNTYIRALCCGVRLLSLFHLLSQCENIMVSGPIQFCLSKCTLCFIYISYICIDLFFVFLVSFCFVLFQFTISFYTENKYVHCTQEAVVSLLRKNENFVQREIVFYPLEFFCPTSKHTTWVDQRTKLYVFSKPKTKIWISIFTNYQCIQRNDRTVPEIAMNSFWIAVIQYNGGFLRCLQWLPSSL